MTKRQLPVLVQITHEAHMLLTKLLSVIRLNILSFKSIKTYFCIDKKLC